MKWVCDICGYIIDREGYTEICPQCWQPSMHKEDTYEQKDESTRFQADPIVAGQ